MALDLSPRPPVRPSDTAVTAECRRIWSLRPALVLLAAAGTVVVAGGLATSAALAGPMAAGTWDPASRLLPPDPTAATLAGLLPAQLLVGVAGVLAAGRRPGASAIPGAGTPPVVWARAAVYGGTVLVLMAAACLAAFLGGRTFFTTAGVEVAFSDGPSGSPAVLRAVTLGAPFYLAVVAVLAVVAGMLVRHRVAAIALVLGATTVVGPVLTLLLPEPARELVVAYLPGAAGEAFRSVAPRPDLLAPWRGFALLSTYLVAAVAGAGWVLRHRG